MTKHTVLLVVAIFLWFTSYGQREEKISRYQSLSKKSKVADAPSLLEEASIIKNTNPKEALNLVEEALAISITRNDVHSEGRCYILLAEINERINEWKLALENYSLARDKLSSGKLGEGEEYRKSLIGMANMHLKLGQYDQSIQAFNAYLAATGSPKERAEGMIGLSEIYFQMGDYDRALSSVEDAEKLSRRLDDVTRATISNQKAKIFARTNNVEQATSLYQSSQNTISRSRGAATEADFKALNSAKDDIINTLREQNRIDDEIQLRNEAIEYNLESNQLKEVAIDKVELGKALASKGETSDAVRELEEAAFIADTIGNPKEKAKAYLALAELYERNDNPARAIDAYKNYRDAVTTEDSMNETKLADKSDLIRKQRDIEEVTKYVEIWRREETIREAIVYRQRLTIYGLSFIILIVGVTSFFIYKNARASQIANQLLALKSLRSQMNPHFIFNALNSVNHFIAQNDERTANRFLSEFSMLMRLVLENSQEDFISLQKEYDIISLYLKLEHYRFRDKFDYQVNVDDIINMEVMEIPPMLIQPYIENAVWHGLRYKETKGMLTLAFRKERTYLVVEITDDGIGRQRSSELKTANQKKHNSTGLKNIEERLTIINKVYRQHYQVTVEDLLPDTKEGTRVLIHLPIKQHTL